MNAIHINVDAGEGEPQSDPDIQLLSRADAINIALGGHAGDPNWSRELARMAMDVGCEPHLHPSYPDRDGFGRRKVELDWKALSDALTKQREILPAVTTCKFHGALYNEACVDRRLADRLARWCDQHHVECLLAPAKSQLASAATEAGIRVMREAFGDRRYQEASDPVGGESRLILMPRSEAGSVIEAPDDVLSQVTQIHTRSTVALRDGATRPIASDTICIHGDAANSIACLDAIRRAFPKGDSDD